MARKYPLEVDEVIHALRSEGVAHKEIRARLARGTAGLEDRYEFPDASYWYVVNRVKKTKGEPMDAVEKGQEEESLDALLRSSIASLKRDKRRIDKRERDNGKLSAQDRSALIQNTKAILDFQRRLADRDARMRESDISRGSQPSPVLARLRSLQTGQTEDEEQGQDAA